ncbi:MAG: acyltransferase [Thermoleophilia bacterium]|nr:acyltransferase [Thermoleophilia bacterium]
MPGLATRLILEAIQAADRARLRRRMRRHPGLVIAPDASTNPASSHFALAPGAELVIGPRVHTERRAGGVHISVAEGARVEIGAGTWLRSDLGTVHLFAFPGARITIGRDGFLNGCHLSSKRAVTLGERVWIGPGSRVFDADQHDLDAERREQIAPVSIGDHCWIAADVTILRGVEIGEQSVVGARSLVARSIPPHSLAYGHPAAVHGAIGDRSRVPI